MHSPKKYWIQSIAVIACLFVSGCLATEGSDLGKVEKLEIQQPPIWVLCEGPTALVYLTNSRGRPISDSAHDIVPNHEHFGTAGSDECSTALESPLTWPFPLRHANLYRARAIHYLLESRAEEALKDIANARRIASSEVIDITENEHLSLNPASHQSANIGKSWQVSRFNMSLDLVEASSLKILGRHHQGNEMLVKIADRLPYSISVQENILSMIQTGPIDEMVGIKRISRRISKMSPWALTNQAALFERVIEDDAVIFKAWEAAATQRLAHEYSPSVLTQHFKTQPFSVPPGETANLYQSTALAAIRLGDIKTARYWIDEARQSKNSDLRKYKSRRRQDEQTQAAIKRIAAIGESIIWTEKYTNAREAYDRGKLETARRIILNQFGWLSHKTAFQTIELLDFSSDSPLSRRNMTGARVALRKKYRQDFERKHIVNLFNVVNNLGPVFELNTLSSKSHVYNPSAYHHTELGNGVHRISSEHSDRSQSATEQEMILHIALGAVLRKKYGWVILEGFRLRGVEKRYESKDRAKFETHRTNSSTFIVLFLDSAELPDILLDQPHRIWKATDILGDLAPRYSSATTWPSLT